MKKFMAMLLTLVMALSLVACGQKADDTKKDDAADTDDSLVVLENVVDWGETEPYRVLVQKGDPKGLLPGINKAIAELTANDGALDQGDREQGRLSGDVHPRFRVLRSGRRR